MTVHLTLDLGRRADLVDDGGRPLEAALVTTAEIAAAVKAAAEAGCAIMPAGGLTSAVGSFEYDRSRAAEFHDVVAIRPKGALTPDLVDAATPLQELRSDQMAIDRESATVSAGAGLTWAQVNEVLKHMLGPTARVMVDLTSVGSAQVGGVVATGGMGPLRQPPSATLDAVCLAEGGEQPRLLTGAAIRDHEGLQGWTGMVTAARMRWFEVPPYEFGLVLPVQGTDTDGLADLLTWLHPWTRLEIPADGNLLLSPDGQTALLDGVELIARTSLEQFVAQAADPARSKAEGLLQACDYAAADMLVCLTGFSDMALDEVLCLLLDDNETIGGVGIEYGVGFSTDTEMEIFRAIREGAPDIARSRARTAPPGGLRPWTTSTDLNVAVPRDSSAIAGIVEAYGDYRTAIGELAGKFAGRAEIALAAYGHLSPQGVDPHHRVTIFAAAGQEEALGAARHAVLEEKRRLIGAVVEAAARSGCTLTGGEKGLPSVLEIAGALGEDRLPDNLRRRLERARRTVAEAPPAFRFRAPGVLLP